VEIKATRFMSPSNPQLVGLVVRMNGHPNICEMPPIWIIRPHVVSA
jgi:hypothetical protein